MHRSYSHLQFRLWQLQWRFLLSVGDRRAQMGAARASFPRSKSTFERTGRWLSSLRFLHEHLQLIALSSLHVRDKKQCGNIETQETHELAQIYSIIKLSRHLIIFNEELDKWCKKYTILKSFYHKVNISL